MGDKPPVAKLPFDFSRLLAFLPVVGAPFRGAEGKSEYDVVVSAGGVITALPDCPGWAKAVALAILGAGFAVSRALKKSAAVLLLGALALGLGGCGRSVDPYLRSMEGMADTGDAVRPLVRSPLSPGEQALVDAWDFQRAAGHKLASGK